MNRAVSVSLVSVGVILALSACENAGPPLEAEAITGDMIAQGQEIFGGGSCAKCHKADGTGGRRGPDISDARWSHADGSPTSIREVIRDGVAKDEIKSSSYSRAMKPLGGLEIGSAELDALAAYVWSLSTQAKEAVASPQ